MQNSIKLPKGFFISIVNREEDGQLVLWNGNDWSRILEGCFKTDSIETMEAELIRMSAMDIEGDPAVIQIPEDAKGTTAKLGVFYLGRIPE